MICICPFSPKRYAMMFQAGLNTVLARMSMFDLYNLIYFCAGIDGVAVSIYAHTLSKGIFNSFLLKKDSCNVL